MMLAIIMGTVSLISVTITAAWVIRELRREQRDLAFNAEVRQLTTDYYNRKAGL